MRVTKKSFQPLQEGVAQSRQIFAFFLYIYIDPLNLHQYTWSSNGHALQSPHGRKFPKYSSTTQIISKLTTRKVLFEFRKQTKVRWG